MKSHEDNEEETKKKDGSDEQQAAFVLHLNRTMRMAQLDYPVCPKCGKVLYPGTECLTPECVEPYDPEV